MYRGPSIDHTILSPSGRVSKRARDAALKREAERLFKGVEWDHPLEQPSEHERDFRQAARLRELAGRGMSARKYRAEAGRLEAKWSVNHAHP